VLLDTALPPTTYVGIDVAATTLAVVVSAVPGAQAVVNTAPGWQQLQAWLVAPGAQPAATLVVLEATGAYWQGVATALTGGGWTVSVVSPSSVRHDAQARLRRAKTDRVDAAVLAAYGRAVRPAPWTPPPADVQTLQLLIRPRDDLIALQTATRHRQHALQQLPAIPEAVRAS